MKTALLFLMPSLLSLISFTGNWKADDLKVKISFTVDGPFGMVHGSFSGLKSTFQFNASDISSSSITASIDPNTVSSGVGLRNTDLKNKEEWLNTKKYPEIKIVSKKIEKSSTGYIMTGELTLKDVTKPIKIPFTFSPAGNDGTFKGQFSIKRMDYHVGKEGGSVGSTINISITVPVTKS